MKSTFLSCSTHTSSLHPDVPSSWKLFTHSLQLGPLFRVAQPLTHLPEGSVILRVLWLLLSAASSPGGALTSVYLGILTALSTCGHRKKSITVSWIKKWDIKYCYLCMQTPIFFSGIVLPYMISPFNHGFVSNSSHLWNLWHTLLKWDTMKHVELCVILLIPSFR